MFITLQQYKDQKWDGWTLLFPVVSVGNAAQLAVDLILSSVSNELVGYIHSTALLPIVGGNPYHLKEPRLATACQVYACASKQLLIVQQRTPVSPSGRAEYRNFLTQWIQRERFGLVIMLSSCLSQFQKPSEMECPVHYVSTPDVPGEVTSRIETLGWKRLEKQDPFTKEANPDGVLLMPGSGIARPLLEQCVGEGIPVVLVLLYCSEGDNTPDAVLLANRINEWIQLTQEPWKTPISWSMLFGGGPPPSIY